MKKQIINLNPSKQPNAELVSEEYIYQAYTNTLRNTPISAIRTFMNLCILHWDERSVINTMYEVVREKESLMWFEKGREKTNDIKDTHVSIKTINKEIAEEMK